MSRSKKAPYWVDGSGTKWKKKAKKQANKVVKATKEVANGGSYKKIFESWLICDFRFPDPKNPKAYRK